MNAADLNKKMVMKALNESLEHWHRFATGTQFLDESIYGDDCSCCKLFVGCHMISHDDGKLCWCPLSDINSRSRFNCSRDRSLACCNGRWEIARISRRPYVRISRRGLKFRKDASAIEKFIKYKIRYINKLGRKWKYALRGKNERKQND